MRYRFPTDTAIVVTPRETFRQSFIEEAVPDGRHPPPQCPEWAWVFPDPRTLPCQTPEPQKKTDVNGRAVTDSTIVGRRYLFIGIQGGWEGTILRIERLWQPSRRSRLETVTSAALGCGEV